MEVRLLGEKVREPTKPTSLLELYVKAVTAELIAAPMILSFTYPNAKNTALSSIEL
jgi:hypothetical protein